MLSKKEIPFVLKITTLFVVLSLAVVNPKIHFNNVKEEKKALSYNTKAPVKKFIKLYSYPVTFPF